MLLGRWTLAAAAALAASVALAASARTVQTGSAVRILRSGSEADQPTILWATVAGDDVRLIALNGRMVPGARYNILDEQGQVGYVITSTVEVDRSCRTFTYESVRLRLQGARPGASTYGLTLAIGPMRDDTTRAKLIVASGADHLPSGVANLFGVVDIDGDRRADLARYIFSCKGTHPATTAYGGNTCVQIWSRAGDAWKRLDEGDFPPCN